MKQAALLPSNRAIMNCRRAPPTVHVEDHGKAGLPFGCNAKGGTITRQLSADVFEASASRAEGISPLPRSTEETTHLRSATSFASGKKSAAQ